MKIRFTDHQPQLAITTPSHSAVLPVIPAPILDRHRARVLRPGDAPLAVGSTMPMSTIYRYDRVMMCHQALAEGNLISDVDDVLSGIGVRVDRSGLNLTDACHPHPVPLRSSDGTGTVDAWAAIQTLRSAVRGNRCSPKLAERVWLEHLLVGSALTAPRWMRGTADDNGGWPSGSGPYSTHGGGAGAYVDRMPVDLLTPMPTRRDRAALPGGRRPVVAVLDTGVTAGHPAFTVSDRAFADDAFVITDEALQEKLERLADPTSPVLRGAWDDPEVPGSLLGGLASHYGHGTFIAGIIRQLAPDAQVRSIRVMHNDGLVYENECVAALNALADDVHRAREGDPTADPVDIVSLSFGYVDETPEDVPSGGLADAMLRLTDLGVPVVCAAGNLASDRPFYPAAFAATPPQPESSAPVLSVGALNPNGTVAMFSNGGPWVGCYATGAGLVSTVPYGIDGSAGPAQERTGAEARESLDPDDFATGFAVWNGTSFAAPVVAAGLADAMANGPVSLSRHDRDAVARRVRDAIKSIGG